MSLGYSVHAALVEGEVLWGPPLLTHNFNCSIMLSPLENHRDRGLGLLRGYWAAVGGRQSMFGGGVLAERGILGA
jgi:hypothetical protein